MMMANISQHHNKERNVPREHVKEFVRVWRLLDGLSDDVEQLEVPEVLAIDNGDEVEERAETIQMRGVTIGVDEIETISSDSDEGWEPQDEMELLGEHLDMQQTKFRLHFKSPVVAPSIGNKKENIQPVPFTILCNIES